MIENDVLMTSSKNFCLSIIYTFIVSFTMNVQAKQLKVGIGLVNYPPFNFEKEGKRQGAVIEIFQYITKQLGYDIIYEQSPWSRIQLYLQNGNIDIAIHCFKTPEREKFMVFTDTPHIFDTSYLFTKRDSKIKFDGTLNSIDSNLFGHVRGYSHGISYNQNKKLRKYQSNNEQQLIRMLLKGRIDIGVGNKAVINFHAKQINRDREITFLSPPLNISPVYFAFPKSRIYSKELAEKFSIEVKKFIITQKYRDILDKYGIETQN